jgi:transcriptional regulator GlxA family with amidase domain
MSAIHFVLPAVLVLLVGMSTSITPAPSTPANIEGGQERQAPRNVAIVVHAGVELLDFAGPAQVFASANANGRPAFRVYTVAPANEPVRTNQQVMVVPDYSIDDCPKPDIVVIPGGSTNVLLQDERAMAWIRRVVQESELTLTVCTGVFTLANQGLLDGMKATTHHSAIAGLRGSSPNIQVLENVRFVDNGRIVTSAGISAGIDGSLHVVSRLCGPESAKAAARYMEYDWSPPADAQPSPAAPAAGG